MSVIDTLNHSIVSYDPKSTKPFTGQRLSKVTFKTITDKESPLCGIKRESKCVSMPLVAIDDVIGNVAALAPVMVEYLHSVQDKITRELVEAGAVSVAMDAISIAACIDWLESNNESGRLTKESVGSWFDAEIAESLAMVLGEKLGVSEVPTNAQSEQVLKVLGSFKDKVSALAGGKTSYEPKLCESLKKCLELAPAGDVLAQRFTKRLDKMIADSAGAVDLMDLL